MWRETQILEVTESLDTDLAAIGNQPAVFLIWPHEGAPYLAKTNLLRRRLERLLRKRDQPSRLLNLREVASRIEYWLTASQIEAALLLYHLARRHFPDDYPKRFKLRMPSYLKLLLSNEFPRTQVTTRLGGGPSVAYGPFRSRNAAEQFEARFLDLFQLRRCQEDLTPSPEHPGCAYGEMNMCLRPCQQVVSPAEYRSEAARVEEFLHTGGTSLVERITAARDRASELMEFEEAARLHKRLERVDSVLRLREDLVCDVDQLNGVVVAVSNEPDCVELWFVLGGCWLEGTRFHYGMVEGRSVSLDQRLRELAGGLAVPKLAIRERQEHLAILARWFYSSWREGEWVGFADPRHLPYRKLVNAVHRVARQATSKT